jgi:cation transporter-like permease
VQANVDRLRRDSAAQGAGHQKEPIVQLIVYYLVFMIAGDLAAYFLGLLVEREFGSHVSLIVFLALYFLFLWISWLLAVWMTEPKRVRPAATA